MIQLVQCCRHACGYVHARIVRYLPPEVLAGWLYLLLDDLLQAARVAPEPVRRVAEPPVVAGAVRVVLLRRADRSVGQQQQPNCSGVD